jgi:Protein of unknown function (DUF4058)
MPIHIRENQYKGVNAHLNSYLQNQPGGWWEVFHSNHIAEIRNAIDSILPPGYYALNEKSLQIDTFDITTGQEQRNRTKLDVGIYGTQPANASGSATATPTAIIPVMETIDDEDFLNSVVIYQKDSDHNIQPVTRIELLSPSNKPPSSSSHFYLTRRNETILGGINLVEIDYLHQTFSPIWILPSYPQREKDSYPYMILVSNPHPNLSEGVTKVFGFRVDDPIPLVDIPLLGDDRVAFDLNEVYHRNYIENRYFYEVAADYEQKPMNFGTYDAEDQSRIEARMAAIRKKFEASN